jgi:hypothetical protein
VVEDWDSSGGFPRCSSSSLGSVRVIPMPPEEQGFAYLLGVLAWLLIWARGSRVAARSGAPSRLAADAHAPLARSPNSVSLIDRTEPRSVLCVSRSALLWLFVVRNGH